VKKRLEEEVILKHLLHQGVRGRPEKTYEGLACGSSRHLDEFAEGQIGDYDGRHVVLAPLQKEIEDASSHDEGSQGLHLCV